MSLAIEAILLAGLMFAGIIPTPVILQTQKVLIVDLVSPSQSEAGRMKSIAAPSTTPPSTEPSKLEAATPTQLPSEWSVSKLPPLSTKSAAPQAAEASTSGLATVGQKTGAGIDPYAFAGYQPALVRQVIGEGLKPNAEGLTQLRKLLRQRLIDRGIAIDVHLMIARDGHVTYAEVTSPLNSAGRAIVATLVTGMPLFPADAARSETVQATVTLNI